MSTVTIFYPNARRLPIKIQPNTTILEILEEASKKQGLNPNEYSLVYEIKKQVLDISLTYRLTGLSNNATLELRKLDIPRKYQDINIVLQMNDGSKLSPKSFKPDITSIEMILQAYKEDKGSELIKTGLLTEETDSYITCTYLNEQVCGMYQLKNTTLKDLGLISGRGLLRFDILKINSEKFQKKTADFEKKLEKKVKLEEIYQKKRTEAKEEAELEAKKMKMSSVSDEIMPSEIKPEKQVTALGPVQSNDLINIIEKPAPKEFAEFKFSNKDTVSSKIEKKSFETTIKKPVNEFANFKFPEETKGQLLNNYNELYDIEKTSKEACDRQGVLVNMDENINKTDGNIEKMDTDSELPDDVFDITLQDLKKMMGELKKSQNDENMLMTKQMRELEQDKKAMKYPQVAIRICFKNRVFLQGIFRPKESISALYKFVENSISNELNSKDDLEFHLYISPPKEVLKDMKKTLFENQLYPAAQVYFKNKSERVPDFNRNDDIRIVDVSEAREIVSLNIHQKLREVNHQGIEWLQKEQAAAGQILKSSGLNDLKNNTHNNQSRTRISDGSQSNVNDATKKKLGLFLGKK